MCPMLRHPGFIATTVGGFESHRNADIGIWLTTKLRAVG
jgi:hypothetical protein